MGSSADNPLRPDPSTQTRERLQAMRAAVRERLFGPPADGHASTLDGAERPADREEDDDPRRIGRFTVLRALGQGGMGVVFAAYDESLDRKVAVKLIRPGQAGEAALARLQREAQALAKLSHPNIVSVYETGPYRDQVYMAMEYVEGTTLAQWQGSDLHPWRDVLTIYVAAGRGLAAAHRAGIVHRDFKPTNVLVREAGAPRDRVRVVDFGLARTEASNEASARASESPEASEPTETALTRTGAVMGTPAYMAPEQFLGRSADARSDQFSFCIALFEALYGFRPFSGETLDELRQNVLEGHREPVPPQAPVPSHVAEALLRGLNVDPALRWPTLEALLDALSIDPSMRRRRLLGWTGAALVGLAVGGWAWSARRDARTRDETETLRAAFARARVGHAEAELQRLRSRSLSERWDDLVLAYAREHVEEDPTASLAALEHLTPHNESWLGPARVIAAAAAHRSPLRQRYDLTSPPTAWILTVEERLILVDAAGEISEFDLRTHAARRVGALPHPYQAACIAADGSSVAALLPDDRWIQWTLERGLGPERALTSTATAIGCGPSEQHVALGYVDGTISIAGDSGDPPKLLVGHDEPITTLAFDARGLRLASATSDGTVRAWFLDRDTHREQARRPGPVEGLQWAPGRDDLWIELEGDDVARWNVEDGRGLDIHSGSAVAFDPSGTGWVVADPAQKVLRISEPAVVDWRAPPGERGLATSQRHLIALYDTVIDVWDRPVDESANLRAPQPRGYVELLAFSPTAEHLVVGTDVGFELWNAELDVLRRRSHGRSVDGVSFSPDGTQLVSWGSSGPTLVLDTRSPESDPRPLPLPHGGAGRTQDVGWTKSGILVELRDRDSGVDVNLYPPPFDEVFHLGSTPAFTKAILVHGEDTAVTTDFRDFTWWDLRDGRSWESVLPDETGFVETRAWDFARDGSGLRVAQVTRHEEAGRLTLSVWQLDRGGEPSRVLLQADLTSVIASPDRASLLLEFESGRRLLWSLRETRFRVLPDDLGPIHRFDISPSADRLLLHADHRSRDILIDVDSGEWLYVAALNHPLAWSARDVIVDTVEQSRVRRWVDPTPKDTEAFLEWLDQTTAVELPAERIR